MEKKLDDRQVSTVFHSILQYLSKRDFSNISLGKSRFHISCKWVGNLANVVKDLLVCMLQKESESRIVGKYSRTCHVKSSKATQLVHG